MSFNRENSTVSTIALRNSSRLTWQVAQVKVILDAFFTAEVQGLIERDKASGSDDSLVDFYRIEANIKISLTVCAGYFIFHRGYSRESALY